MQGVFLCETELKIVDNPYLSVLFDFNEDLRKIVLSRGFVA